VRSQRGQNSPVFSVIGSHALLQPALLEEEDAGRGAHSLDVSARVRTRQRRHIPLRHMAPAIDVLDPHSHGPPSGEVRTSRAEFNSKETPDFGRKFAASRISRVGHRDFFVAHVFSTTRLKLLLCGRSSSSSA